MHVLSKGLNFATCNTNKDKVNFIAAVEPIISDIDHISATERDTIRSQVTSALKSAQNCNNLDISERKALKELQNDQSISIVQADKGKTTVVLDKHDYEEKVLDHLSNSDIYQELQENPINTLKLKVNKKLK